MPFVSRLKSVISALCGLLRASLKQSRRSLFALWSLLCHLVSRKSLPGGDANCQPPFQTPGRIGDRKSLKPSCSNDDLSRSHEIYASAVPLQLMEKTHSIASTNSHDTNEPPNPSLLHVPSNSHHVSDLRTDLSRVQDIGRPNSIHLPTSSEHSSGNYAHLPSPLRRPHSHHGNMHSNLHDPSSNLHTHSAAPSPLRSPSRLSVSQSGSVGVGRRSWNTSRASLRSAIEHTNGPRPIQAHASMIIPDDPSKEPYESHDPVDWQYVPRQAQRLANLSAVATQQTASMGRSPAHGSNTHLGSQLEPQTSSVDHSDSSSIPNVGIRPPSSPSSPRSRTASSEAQSELNRITFEAAPQAIDAAVPRHEVFYPDKGKRAKLWPMTPSLSDRYERPRHVEREDAQYTVLPMQKLFIRKHVPNCWEPLVHPEGTLFYRDQSRHVITETFIEEEENLKLLEFYFSKMLFPLLAEHGIQLSSEIQLVVELVKSSDPIHNVPACGYYLVDYVNHCLFWPVEFVADWLVEGISGKVTDSHFGIIFRAEYWQHREYFPGLHQLLPEEIKLLNNRLIGLIGDSIGSSQSTSIWEEEKMRSMLELTQVIKEEALHSGHVGLVDADIEWFVARSIAGIEFYRFVNFHGEQHARLNVDTSIHSERPKHPRLLALISPLLFYAPDAYNMELHKIFVDGAVVGHRWQEFIGKLTEEWQSFLLLGEVLLTANVSFLAIPSVDTTNQGQSANPVRSFAQISSYVSSVAAFGSIIMALLLMRQNSTKSRDKAGEANKFLSTVSDSLLGLEGLVIIYSLPYALLIWSVLSFAAGFCDMCFAITELPTQLPVGLSAALVFLLVCWCIFSSWDWTESLSTSFRLEAQLLGYWQWWIQRLRGQSHESQNQGELLPVSHAEDRILVV